MGDPPFTFLDNDRPGRTTKRVNDDGEVVETSDPWKAIGEIGISVINPENYVKLELPEMVSVTHICEVDGIEDVPVGYVFHDIEKDGLHLWSEVDAIENGVAHLTWYDE